MAKLRDCFIQFKLLRCEGNISDKRLRMSHVHKLCAPTYHYNDAIRKGNKREEILQHALQIYLGKGRGGRGDKKAWPHSTTNMPSRITFIQNESSPEINRKRTNHISIFLPNIRCFGMFSTKRSSIYHWSKEHPTTWFPTQHNREV